MNYRLTDPILPPELEISWTEMNSSKAQALKEFNDNKLGMFIHWGLYSLTSGEWEGKKVFGLGEWIMWRAMIEREDYGRLAKEFNPTEFNPQEWVALAKKAGAKYIVITAKHHDGFAMFSSKHSSFNIKETSNLKFEPLDMLYEECQKAGIGFGVYYSHVIDWRDGWCGEGGTPVPCTEPQKRSIANPMNTWDPSDNSRRIYFEEKAYPQLQELLERYPNLYLVWFDYWYGGKYINPAESYKFYKMIYDYNPKCLVNSRVGHDLGDYITAPDNEVLALGELKPWETPGTLNNTWGYSKFDHDWKGELELIYWMISICSRGGNYLLNIGPKADGAIPEETTKSMSAIGAWLAINGEAIYGSTAWDVDHEGPSSVDFGGTDIRENEGFVDNFSSEDFWFTAKGNTIYAIALKREQSIVSIKSLNSSMVKIKYISVLGSSDGVEYEQSSEGLKISLPKINFKSIGYVLKIEVF